ncbi:hypothetical protein INT43_004091 [Umbelopsis isabellina]|uniref:Uncharacterized protein n=1 Tax=Mortierella isabellina TaxID=91625 RepID=A0A8H7PU07_MORIS|nr:hypothetical protein INT43_004091 [Umbelopsis isabellina]
MDFQSTQPPRTEEEEIDTTPGSGRLSSNVVKDIEHRIDERFQAVFGISTIDDFQREGAEMDKHPETVSNEEKMKWVEVYVARQRQDIQQAKHEILLLRQNTVREYSDYMATMDMAMRNMIEVLRDTTSHDQHHYRIYENYMRSLTESLTLKLEYVLLYLKLNPSIFSKHLVRIISVLNSTMRVNTYDPETVQALEVIRSSLETQHEELKTRLEETDAKLDGYKNQGPDFEEIARSYAEVIDKIRDTKDHIARISSTV